MGIILSIETATPVGSVAIHEEGKLLGFIEIHTDRSHASRLAPAIKNLLNTLSLHQSDLAGIAISRGPGSYTGLRIGASTAKGLAFSLNLPLIELDTLYLLYRAVIPSIDKDISFVIPMLDARRMEVYSTVYSTDGEILEATQPVILDETSYSTFLSKGKALLCGDGSNKSLEILKSGTIQHIKEVYPSARLMGEPAWKKFLEKDFVSLNLWEPFYLKAFQATQPKAR